MISRLTRRLAVPAIIAAAVALMANPGTAQATLTVTIDQTAGTAAAVALAPIVIVDGTIPNAVSFNGDYGDFTGSSPAFGLGINVTSNAPGTSLPDPIGGRAVDATSAIRNGSDVTATLTVMVVATGFTAPVGSPLDLLNALSVTTFNGVFGARPGESASFISSLVSAVTTSTTSVSLTGPGAAFTTASAPRAPGSYTLTSLLTITLNARGEINLTGTTQATGTNVMATVPEPSTMVSAAVGLVILGLGLRRHRRAAS